MNIIYTVIFDTSFIKQFPSDFDMLSIGSSWGSDVSIFVEWPDKQLAQIEDDKQQHFL